MQKLKGGSESRPRMSVPWEDPSTEDVLVAARILRAAGVEAEELRRLFELVDEVESHRQGLVAALAQVADIAGLVKDDVGDADVSKEALHPAIGLRQRALLAMMPPGDPLSWNALADGWGAWVGVPPARCKEAVRNQLRILKKHGLVEKAGRGLWRRTLPTHPLDFEHWAEVRELLR